MNSIGKVNFVSYEKLAFEISDYEKLQFNKNGKFYISKGILDFVTIINNQNEKFIYQVERLEEVETAQIPYENSKFMYKTKVICRPIGIIKNDMINFNMKTYPFLQNKVYLTTIEEFKIIFKNNSMNSIKIGLISELYLARFDINEILTYHSAVLGNTGSGKSTTIRQLLTEIQKNNYSNLNIHVFDVHDEYSNITNCESINVLEEYVINPVDLELQDWINLVKPSDLVQLPILRMSLKLAYAIDENKIDEVWLKCYLAKTLYHHVQTDAVAKRTKIIHLLKGTSIDTSKYDAKYGNLTTSEEELFLESIKAQMNNIHETDNDDEFLSMQLDDSLYKAQGFDELTKALNYVFYLEESKGNSQVRVHSTTLEIRIKEIQLRYSKLFYKRTMNLDNNQVTVYNLSELDDDMLLFFSSYFCKKKLNENKNKILKDRIINVFVFEEAHRYVSREKDNSQMHEIEIFKRIAREGRKFGCFIYLSSQRPSELSSTVLSQCNNYLLHRIKNNIDLDYMSKTIPYIDVNQLTRLSFLPTGTMFAIGEMFPIPVEIDVFPPTELNDVTSTPKIIKLSSTH
ncbi:ATP-binding protein [Erysipelothrix rhusiopathiae]|uniref:ATP-binding protein n=1 Tax=Erysipelothrix rhusiopathiae TaxID=1648 RepID=UPI000F42E526|nr:ATP-binding protein [Erysipelothrix rhusiopathiae]AYV34222.1 ATP-binding protein [Erysipelothrix rhusiopathiae]